MQLSEQLCSTVPVLYWMVILISPPPLFSGSCDTQVVHDLGGSPSVFDAHEDLPCHLPDGRLVCS